MSWVPFETEGAEEFIKDSVVSNVRGTVTLYENGGLFSLIRKKDNEYWIWETDFNSRGEAQRVLNSL